MFTSTTKILQINVIVNLITAGVLHQARNNNFLINILFCISKLTHDFVMPI